MKKLKLSNYRTSNLMVYAMKTTENDKEGIGMKIPFIAETRHLDQTDTHLLIFSEYCFGGNLASLI